MSAASRAFIPHRDPVILLVDDEQVIADTLAIILNMQGYRCTAAYNGFQAIEKARSLRPRLILMNVNMPGMNGVDASIEILNEQPDCKILLHSGQAATADLLEDAVRRGYHFEPPFAKPLHPQDLVAELARRGIQPCGVPAEAFEKDGFFAALGWHVEPVMPQPPSWIAKWFRRETQASPMEYLLTSSPELGGNAYVQHCSYSALPPMPRELATNTSLKRVIYWSYFKEEGQKAARDKNICLIRYCDSYDAADALRDPNCPADFASLLRRSILATAGQWSFEKVIAEL